MTYTVWSKACEHLTITLLRACWTTHFRASFLSYYKSLHMSGKTQFTLAFGVRLWGFCAHSAVRALVRPGTDVGQKVLMDCTLHVPIHPKRFFSRVKVRAFFMTLKFFHTWHVFTALALCTGQWYTGRGIDALLPVEKS